MKDLLKETKLRYFLEVADRVPKCDIQFIILIHIVSDLEELLQAFEAISPIACVIAIPYSIDQSSYQDLRAKFNIIRMDLDKLLDKTSLIKNIMPHLNLQKQTIIVEIGGYFAEAINDLYELLGNNLLGVIEDTEAGHRRYENILNEKQLPCPVISVARSVLKTTEDFLVGKTCLFSAEKLLRQAGLSLHGKSSLVLGYGKIGRSLAYALRSFHNAITIYDTDAVKCVSAISEGFRVISKIEALRQAHYIYGAAGQQSISSDDFQYIKSGAVLFSCSSKQVEIDIGGLKSMYQHRKFINNLDLYKNNDNCFYVAADGYPINFIDPDARIGPVITLTHAELIFAVKYLILRQAPKGMFEINNQDKKFLADKWLQYFNG